MNQVAFLTTVFPMDISYLKEMLDSLKAQTLNKFDLIVVNDGLVDFDEVIENYKPDINVVELKGKVRIAENRKIGINYCISAGYDFLVFGDSDDTFSKNRIEHSLRLLQNKDIVVNDLTLFENDITLETRYLSNRLNNNQSIKFDYIKDKNVFGLSNTAIKLDGLSPITLPNELVAVDWYLFSFLLLQGKQAIFTNDAVTYYRQYDGNLVGLKGLDEVSFQRGWLVKKTHYQALSQITDKVKSECKKYSEPALVYKNQNSDQSHPLWWELI